jgi:chromosome partitioning protein
LDAITFSRNVYDDSEESGKSVMEIEADGKAAAEIRSIVSELFSKGQGNVTQQFEKIRAIG